MDPKSLLTFADNIANGRLRVIDLTFTLSPDFPVIVLPPEFGQASPVRIRADLSVRQIWTRVVLEQPHRRRTYRYTFRCSNPLGHRQGSPQQLRRYAPDPRHDRPRVRHRLLGGGGSGSRLSVDHPGCGGVGEAARKDSSPALGAAENRLVKKEGLASLRQRQRGWSAHAGTECRNDPLVSTRTRRTWLWHRNDRDRCGTSRPFRSAVSSSPLSAWSRKVRSAMPM